MRDKIKRFINSEMFRYVIVGGTTTLVDLALYFLMTEILHWDVTLSNILSIAVSILYAYVTNKWFVFQSHVGSMKELWAEFSKFIGGRLGTMALEVGCTTFFAWMIGEPFAAKILTQVIIFVANYIISKFWAFGDKKQ